MAEDLIDRVWERFMFVVDTPTKIDNSYDRLYARHNVLKFGTLFRNFLHEHRDPDNPQATPKECYRMFLFERAGYKRIETLEEAHDALKLIDPKEELLVLVLILACETA